MDKLEHYIRLYSKAGQRIKVPLRDPHRKYYLKRAIGMEHLLLWTVREFEKRGIKWIKSI